MRDEVEDDEEERPTKKIKAGKQVSLIRLAFFSAREWRF
jgi:hypothetical protein